MYSYIYKTTIKNPDSSRNNQCYVGCHLWSGRGLDPNYFGSGRIIKSYLNKYGTFGLVCEILEVTSENYTPDQYEFHRKREGYWIDKIKPELNINLEGQVELCNENIYNRRKLILEEYNSKLPEDKREKIEESCLLSYSEFVVIKKILSRRVYYLENKDKILAKNAEYNKQHDRSDYLRDYHQNYKIKNKEQIKENRHNYYEKTKDVSNKKSRERYLSNQDELKQKNLARYYKNKEKYLETQKAYRYKNKEQIKEKRQEYNARSKVKEARKLYWNKYKETHVQVVIDGKKKWIKKE